MNDVLLEIDGSGVAVITLNQPDRKNVWTPELERRFYATLESADHDPGVRVAVLTGAGSTFCPGVGADRLDQVASSGVDFTGRIPFSQTLTFRKPLIAAINGACAGAGLAQALMCDIRFAAAGVRFSTSFARRGLPAEHGLSWLLPRIVGVERALDLLLSARIFDADEAQQLGVLSQVVEPADLLSHAVAYATDIAENCAPAATAIIKHQVLVDLDATYADALDRAYRTTLRTAREPEFREGVDAFLEKRKPAYPGLSNTVNPAEIVGVGISAIDVDPAAPTLPESMAP